MLQYKFQVRSHLAFCMKSIKRRVSYREIVDRCSPAIFKYDIKNIPDPEKEEECEVHDFYNENTTISNQQDFAIIDAGIENYHNWLQFIAGD